MVQLAATAKEQHSSDLGACCSKQLSMNFCCRMLGYWCRDSHSAGQNALSSLSFHSQCVARQRVFFRTVVCVQPWMAWPDGLPLSQLLQQLLGCLLDMQGAWYACLAALPSVDS